MLSCLSCRTSMLAELLQFVEDCRKSMVSMQVLFLMDAIKN